MLKLDLVGHDYQYEIDEILDLFIEDRERCEYKIISTLDIGNKIAAKTEVFKEDRLVFQQAMEIEDRDYSDNDIRKLSKRILKVTLFKCLKKLTSKKIPWGILTGIRPTKIVHDMIEEGLDRESIFNVLTDMYEIHEKKAELMLEVAEKELKILKRTKPQSIGLYIGIPFCPTRCLYCSFTSNPLDKFSGIVDDYLDALFKEMDCVKDLIIENKWIIESLYVGGGTPTSLNEEQLKRLLNKIDDVFDISGIEEVTIEAGRPDTINAEKLRIIKDYGIERISINPQTMNGDTLDKIGRRHSADEIVESFNLARDIGFTNINMDVIVGLPDETILDVEQTLSKIAELNPDNLTVHTMAIKRASNLKQNIHDYTLTESQKVEKMIEIAEKYAIHMNMYPYYLYRQKNMVGNFENVGYCKKDKECIYNIQIMDEKQTIMALGAGATSKIVDIKENRIERIFNLKNVEEYIKRIDEMIDNKLKFKY